MFFIQIMGKSTSMNVWELFLNYKGIVHQSTCSETPQQNGTFEQKNRHLLEVARAIMFSMNVPKYLWREAILIASYLINRMPTRILNFENNSFKFSYTPVYLSFNGFRMHLFCLHTPYFRIKIGPQSQKMCFHLVCS